MKPKPSFSYLFIPVIFFLISCSGGGDSGDAVTAGATAGATADAQRDNRAAAP